MKKTIGIIVLSVLGVIAVGLGLGLLVMALWNWLMPDLFGLETIGYWQAVGLFVLCHLLFKTSSSSNSSPPRNPFRSKRAGKRDFVERVSEQMESSSEQPT